MRRCDQLIGDAAITALRNLKRIDMSHLSDETLRELRDSCLIFGSLATSRLRERENVPTTPSTASNVVSLAEIKQRR